MSDPRVVVAEDDADIRNLVVRTLGSAADVETFEDGTSCWERLESGPPPDVLLLDVTLPGIDGLELFERVRSDDRLSDVSIVFLTGRDRADLPDTASYVAKPFSPTDLLKRVEELG